MPLPIAHALVGASVVAALQPEPAASPRYVQMMVGGLLANAADLDFLLVYAFDSKSWHRGFTHSFLFSFFVFVLCSLLVGRRRIKTAAAYGIAFASHAVLDFVTTKEGSGVQLFFPLYQERLSLGWWGLSEWPSKLTAWQIVWALALEVALFTPVLLAVMFMKGRSVPTNA